MTTARIIGWSRPNDESWSHAVISVESSVITACRGRWPVTDTDDFVVGRDREVDTSGKRFAKCVACDHAAKLERTEDGLRELAIAELFGGGL